MKRGERVKKKRREKKLKKQKEFYGKWQTTGPKIKKNGRYFFDYSEHRLTREPILFFGAAFMVNYEFGEHIVHVEYAPAQYDSEGTYGLVIVPDSYLDTFFGLGDFVRRKIEPREPKPETDRIQLLYPWKPKGMFGIDLLGMTEGCVPIPHRDPEGKSLVSILDGVDLNPRTLEFHLGYKARFYDIPTMIGYKMLSSEPLNPQLSAGSDAASAVPPGP